MTKADHRLKQLLYPGSETNPWIGVTFEVLLLIIFGAWALIPAYFWLFVKPDPNAYACSGPGPADSGCTGGTDAVVAGMISAIVWLIVFSIFLLALIRLINRMRRT